MASHFKQSYTDDFDREVKASPMASDSITKLHSGEGARAFSAKPKKRTSSTPTRGILIGVALAAIVVIAAGFLLFRAILGDRPQGAGDGTPGTAQEEVQQAEVSVDPATGAVESGTIEYMGETYSLVALEGTSAVVSTDESGNQRSLFVLRGTPVCVLFYDGILLIPENLPDGWDVISYVVGAESQASPIMKDGEAFKGTGEIADAHLEGSELVVVDSAGTSTRFAL